MDTEFPGVVARPTGDNYGDAQYQTLRCNVDLLKLIQLGLSFTDGDGIGQTDVLAGNSILNFSFRRYVCSRFH